MENNLKAYRESLGISQGDFAASLGILPSTYNQYEKGKNKTPIEVYRLIADKYQITIDYLVGHCDSPHGTKYGGIQLTAEEEALVTAWRQADQRAKDDVEHALRNFGFEQEEPKEKVEPA